MTTEPSKIIPVPSAGEDFSLWPYLDTLYRWCESQDWFDAEYARAWAEYTAPGPKEFQALPDLADPDQHDRALRFWSWFTLQRPLPGTSERPVDRFMAVHLPDLTEEGQAIYEELGRSRFGTFRVQKAVPERLVILEDRRDGTRYHLTERALASELQRGDLVVGRIYPHGESYLADPDLHIGHMQEAANPTLPPPEAEAHYFSSQVPAKGHVMDVLDALLLQVDSPITADDVLEMIRTGESLEAVVDELYGAPAYKLRYLHLRDRGLLDELLQELWDTSGPLQEAALAPQDASALSRTVKNALRAIHDGDEAAVRQLADPNGYLPLYLELFGMRGLQRLAGVTADAPGTTTRSKHQLLPKDGGIFSTVVWGKEGAKHMAGVVSFGTPAGEWRISDLSPPDEAPASLQMAYEKAKSLGWATDEAADGVEALLRRAIEEVGYSVHDTIDLYRLWRDFKAYAEPDLAQPAIWAAGLELADSHYRNENLDVKVLSKSYGVMPRAIEDAARQIEAAIKAKDEAEQE